MTTVRSSGPVCRRVRPGMGDDAHVESAAAAETQIHRPAPSDTQGSQQPPGAAGTASGKADAQQAPETVTHTIPPRCRARTRLYRDGALAAEGFPATEIKQRIAQGHCTVWLDLYDPETDDLAVAHRGVRAAPAGRRGRGPRARSGPSSTATTTTCSSRLRRRARRRHRHADTSEIAAFITTGRTDHRPQGRPLRHRRRGPRWDDAPRPGRARRRLPAARAARPASSTGTSTPCSRSTPQIEGLEDLLFADDRRGQGRAAAQLRAAQEPGPAAPGRAAHARGASTPSCAATCTSSTTR